MYFENFAPFEDPFLHYLQTWKEKLPDYNIMKWNAENVDWKVNEWMIRSWHAHDPVFLSEFIRWDVLSKFGGAYLDSDCEVLNGDKFNQLYEELMLSEEFDAVVGVEDFNNGHPTAQTVIAKPQSDLVLFMKDMYETKLSGGLWHWRNERGLIGPQLMSLYFRDRGLEDTKGFFWKLEKPTVVARVKVYPQEYFSPKFTIAGKKLNVTENTCIYHLFSNLNVKEVDPEAEKHRKKPLLFNDYCKYLDSLSSKKSANDGEGFRDGGGDLRLGKIFKTIFSHPIYSIKRAWRLFVK